MKKAIGYVICGGASAMDEIYGTDHCKDALRPYKKIFRKLNGFDDI
jgi:hypothetical protein